MLTLKQQRPAYWALALCLFLAVTPACSGCTDDTAGNNSSGNNREEPVTTVPEGSKLLHVDPCVPTQSICSKDVTFSSSVRLRVQLVDGEQKPIDNTSINFQLMAGQAEGSSLASANAVTDGEGMAETELRAGQQAGTVEVIVTAGTEEGIDPIKFLVAVNDKGRSSYKISFDHIGSADLKDIHVRAFESSVTCNDIFEDHERLIAEGVNPVLTAVTTNSGIAGADGTLPVVIIPNVPNGTAYSFEARGMSRANGEVEASFGCGDENDPIQNGQSVEVTIDLVDNLPRVAGEYTVTHEFNLQEAVCQPNGQGGYEGALPSGVCLAIDLIGRLATDPASFITGTDNSPGILELLVGFLPDGSLKDTIQSAIDNDFVSAVVHDALQSIFEDWLNNNAPEWVKNAVNITADIFDTLQEFKVNGTLRIRWEPTPSFDNETGSVIGMLDPQVLDVDAGIEELPGKQVWSDVVIHWNGMERPFSANDVGTDGVVEGYFTGSVVPHPDGGYGLIVDEHTLTLNYGVLLLGILEQVVLPSIFGDQTVTSIEAALDKLVSGVFDGFNGGNGGCQGFALWFDENVGSGNGEGSAIYNIAENLCTSLLAQASETLRSYFVENLTVDGDDNFLIGTPDGAPCKLHEPAMYAGDWTGKPLPYVETLGQDRPELLCNWNVKIKISNDQAAEPDIDTIGTFHGSRTGFISQ